MQSDPINQTLNHPFTVLSVVSMSAASVAVFLMMPLLLGNMMDSLNLTEEQASLRFSAYFAGYSLICIAGYFFIRRVHWQRLAILAYSLLLFGLIMSGRVNSMWLFFTLFVAGSGAGILLGLSVTLISDMKNPDSVFGWQMLAQQSLPALFIVTLPYWLPQPHNFSTLMWVVSLALSTTAFSILGIPARGRDVNQSVQAGFNWSRDKHVLLMMLVVGFYFAVLSGVWAFVERIGNRQGIPVNDISLALGVALVAGAFGGLTAVFGAGRITRKKLLLLLSIVFVGVFSVYQLEMHFILYLFAGMVFSFSWNLCMAFQQGLIASLDHRGCYIVLLPAAIASGAMLGPVIAGMLIQTAGMNFMLLAMSASLLCLSIPLMAAPGANGTDITQEIPTP